MAKGRSGRGNSGSRGQGNRGRSFRVIKPKKKRKGRRQLTNGVFGVPPELRPPWPAPVDPELEDVEEDAGDVDDVAELENRERAEGRTNGGEE